jgi:hypothetical protein
MRYNGGGYLDIASEIAFMIAGPGPGPGPGPTSGEVFEQQIYNDRNPFQLTAAQAITPFHAVAQGFSLTSGSDLATLNLVRVYALVGAGTCSANEAVVNGLRGVGVTVDLIGATTCGKPYGFYPQDNCGTTNFSIQFSGVDQLGQGNYADGFTPTCAAVDDFTHALGDPNENRLAAALGLRSSGVCSPPMGMALARACRRPRPGGAWCARRCARNASTARSDERTRRCASRHRPPPARARVADAARARRVCRVRRGSARRGPAGPHRRARVVGAHRPPAR